MKKTLLVLSLACTSILLNSCGGGGTPPPLATRLAVTTSSAAITVGTPFNVSVSALDSSGAVVSTYSGTVHFASSDPQAVLPKDSPLTNGTKVFQVTFNSPGSQSITVSDATGALTAGTSSPVTVSGAAASQFSVTAAATSPTAGTASNITVKAVDSANNVIASYVGTVHFTSSDAQAVLPANSTLTNGTGTFPVTLKTAGAQTITATDTVTTSIAGTSGPITINPGPVAGLSVSAPAAVTVGIPFLARVNAMDAYGNVATSYAGTVHFTSSDAQATLPANSTLTSGMGSFSVTFKTQGTQTVTATDTVASTITGISGSISVVSNAATHFSISNPGGVSTRQTFSITVSALDAANNTSAGYSGTVHLTSTDTQAMLPANSTLPSGTARLSVTLETAGNQTVTATDTVTPSITGNSGTIGVTQVSALAVTSGSPPNGTVGLRYDPRTVRICNLWRGLICERWFVVPANGFPITGSGGVPPYIWSWASASSVSLPAGLGILNRTNSPGCEVQGGFYTAAYQSCIAGTPTQPGTFNVVLTATDSGLPAVQTSVPYTIQIAPPPPPVVSTTPAPFVGVINKPYSYTFSASGYPPLTWNEQGALPTGLTFDSNTPLLSGTPTQTGSFPIKITATDQFSQSSAAADFTIVIALHGFQATGNMAGPRLAHTATLLNTGKVLVAGGMDANGNALLTAELYDPSTGVFTSTGSMGTARHHFATTLLPSGKVLVTGGLDTSGNPLSSAEIYDPVAGTFSPTESPMIAVHASHTATLLNTGKVLVAGWGNAVAELFDPSTGTFTQTGSMVQARVDHTATLLNSGKVLITGGIQGAPPNTTVLAEAELYDPSAGSFLPTVGSMSSPRHLHTGSLLSDGTVLVAGGLDNAGKALATAEVFDPTTQNFTAAKGSMGSARYFHTATVLTDKTVLLVGGNDGAKALATAEVYDPAAGTFSPTGSLGTARQSHAATILGNGTVIVAGGMNSGASALASAELYQ
jgi:putative Ig domain-containing protein/galactose oxidase-like protein